MNINKRYSKLKSLCIKRPTPHILTVGRHWNKQKNRNKMKNIQKIIILIITISFFSCNPNIYKKKSTENNNSEFQEYEIIFSDLKEHLSKENGKLWNIQLYGPILLIDENNQIIIANEPDSSKVLSKNGKVFIGTLPKDMPISETTINWNGKLWAMVPLTILLSMDHNEQISILTHELYHRIQSKVGLSNIQQKKCNHLDKLDGRIYLKLELEALKMALRTNNKETQIKHIKNALLFRLYRQQLFSNAKESENSLELNEGIAEYTGTILSNWDDKGLRNHYIQAIDTLYKNRTFNRSFAYRTTPIYGYYMNKRNKDWNKEINNKTDLTEYITKQFNVQIPSNLKEATDTIENELSLIHI